MSSQAQASFTLDARLAADTVPLAESSLSCLLLMNERRYPWLILVPKRAGMSELYELTAEDRVKLLDESCLVARSLSEVFAAFKINVGALGNVVRQLHLHHVARFADDAAWPGPVWGHSPREGYAPDMLARVIEQLRGSALETQFRFHAPSSAA